MRQQAKRELENVIFPFWWGHGVDRVEGGVHTCFDNRGEQLLSTDKYVWSQGRWAWILARAARLAERGLLAIDVNQYLSHAEKTVEFLLDNATRSDGTCHFVLTRTGQPVDAPHSVYADLFVVMGVGEFARAAGRPELLEKTIPIVERATSDVWAHRSDTPPYPVPGGYTALGPDLILLNALLVDAQAREELDVYSATHRQRLATTMDRTLSLHESYGTFIEMRGPRSAEETLIARHRVPGHNLEATWILTEAAQLLGRDEVIPEMAASVGPICASGWDPEFGGILRYVDKSGPTMPTGSRTDGDPYEALVVDTWDTKLWWVHTEALHATAVAGFGQGDEHAKEWAKKVWDYTISTFPDPAAREWVQIRDRAGAPLEKTVALPVKDPFHIARALMQVVELEHVPAQEDHAHRPATA